MPVGATFLDSLSAFAVMTLLLLVLTTALGLGLEAFRKRRASEDARKGLRQLEKAAGTIQSLTASRSPNGADVEMFLLGVLFQQGTIDEDQLAHLSETVMRDPSAADTFKSGALSVVDKTDAREAATTLARARRRLGRTPVSAIERELSGIEPARERSAADPTPPDKGVKRFTRSAHVLAYLLRCDLIDAAATSRPTPGGRAAAAAT